MIIYIFRIFNIYWQNMNKKINILKFCDLDYKKNVCPCFQMPSFSKSKGWNSLPFRMNFKTFDFKIFILKKLMKCDSKQFLINYEESRFRF